MKNFKSFLDQQIDELKVIEPKAKGEQEFVKKSYLALVKDPGDLEDVGPEEVGPKEIKAGSGKRPADRLDNKQAFGEEIETVEEQKYMQHPEDVKTSANVLQKFGTKKWLTKDYKNEKPVKEAEYTEYKTGGKPLEKKFEKAMSAMGIKAKVKMKTVNNISVNEEVEVEEETIAEAKTYRNMMKSMKEADFTKQQTKMAHTIGKEFEKKGVGDPEQGGPYAVASWMVKEKPKAAEKAYATIKSKMKEEADAELLFKLYSDLNEDNQEFFMQQLEEDADSLLDFAKKLMDE